MKRRDRWEPLHPVRTDIEPEQLDAPQHPPVPTEARPAPDEPPRPAEPTLDLLEH